MRRIENERGMSAIREAVKGKLLSEICRKRGCRLCRYWISGRTFQAGGIPSAGVLVSRVYNIKGFQGGSEVGGHCVAVMSLAGLLHYPRERGALGEFLRGAVGLALAAWEQRPEQGKAETGRWPGGHCRGDRGSAGWRQQRERGGRILAVLKGRAKRNF